MIGDWPGGCSVLPPHYGAAQAGAGYWHMIDHYGGDWYSICASDWGVQLQNLANALTARRSFPLDESDPIEETIEVTVNGQVSTHWEYNPTTNSVVFAENHTPDEGQTVVINYAVWGCGE